jgi:NAD(P)-dependent dehydrogenase (short-subunit alcohol dehydrogenase family)
MATSMVGKTVVVTGATSGIGYGAVEALLATGATVIGVGRNIERCDIAQAKLLSNHPHRKIKYLIADLASQKQIHHLADEIRHEIKASNSNWLDGLVNNAGFYSAKFILTEDGIELTFAVNHMAPFLLTQELLPLLLQAPVCRVLTVSSSSHYKAWINFKRINKPIIYIGIRAYEMTKLANVLFTQELRHRLTGSNVRAFAVDPGLVNTEIGMKGTGGFSYWFWNERRTKGVGIEIPAKTILYLCTDESVQDSNEMYWRDCRPKEPSQRAKDVEKARKLWEFSAQLCGTSS